MKRKIIIVSCVAWLLCAFGGGLWPRVERYLRERSIPPGQLEVEHLKDLYQAKLFDKVSTECTRAENNSRYADYQPQIVYLHWIVERRLGHSDAVQKDAEMFLSRYPANFLAADIHFGLAMDKLAAGDYSSAERELILVHNHFSTTSTAKKADDILSRLRSAR